MKTSIRTTLLAASLMFAGAALADPTIARLEGLDGNVLVTGDSSLRSAVEGARVTPGARLIAASRSGVTVHFDDGCKVALSAWQRFRVANEQPCAQRLQQVRAVEIPQPRGTLIAGMR